MTSLYAVLAECGVLYELERAMRELDIPEAKIKDLQRQIAELILNTLVDAGHEVVEDFEAE